MSLFVLLSARTSCLPPVWRRHGGRRRKPTIAGSAPSRCPRGERPRSPCQELPCHGQQETRRGRWL